MSLEEAMHIFEIASEAEIKEENIKKTYRSLCFQYHPDAHPSEDFNQYNNIMIEINEAYSMLMRHISNINSRNSYDQKRTREIEKQIIKEKILMNIIVRAYYESKDEINKMNEDFLDYFLSIPQKVGHVTSGPYGRPVVGYRHIAEAFNKKASDENRIMQEYIKNLAIEFANKYGFEIEFLDVCTGEYINFLNSANWFDKYCSYKKQEEPKKLE